MKVSRKLTEWREAGLIDSEVVARIEAHEQGQSRPTVLYAVGGVGAVAIVLGIVAIVASNWAEIPATTKLVVDGLVAVGLAWAILRASPGWTREVLVLVNYGFVLASMALIGQIYHLDSGTWRALLAWSVATGPFMLLAQGRFAATVWIMGLVTTHGFVLFEWLQWLDDGTEIEESTLITLGIVSVGIGPLIHLLVARIPWLRDERPATASMFRAVGWFGVGVLVMTASSLFYESIRGEDVLLLGPLVLVVAYGAFAAILPSVEVGHSQRALSGMRVLLVAGPALGLLSVVGTRGDWPVFAAMLHVFWLGAMAWTALQAGHEGLFRIGVGAVCIRLFGIYIEVFGSMLQTGLGLIVSGMLTIALTWFWIRKSRGLAAALSGADAEPIGRGSAE